MTPGFTTAERRAFGQVSTAEGRIAVLAADQTAVRVASESCTTFAAAELPPTCEVPSWRP